MNELYGFHGYDNWKLREPDDPPDEYCDECGKIKQDCECADIKQKGKKKCVKRMK